MTYLNTAAHISGPDAPRMPRLCPAPRAVQWMMSQIILWLSAAGLEASCASLKSARFRAVLMAAAIVLLVMPGSLAEKKAKLQAIARERQERHARLFAAYLKWRQRKCWMWGGGFMAPHAARLPGAQWPALGPTSFDALIPD